MKLTKFALFDEQKRLFWCQNPTEVTYRNKCSILDAKKTGKIWDFLPNFFTKFVLFDK